MTEQSVVEGRTAAGKKGEGKALWFLGGLYEIRLSSDDTGGATTIVEFTLPPGAGPPPHIHDQDEIAYVVEGKVRFHVNDDAIEAGPGAVFYMPRGTLEWWEPITDSRVLAVYSPGGIDKFFAEVGEPAPRREVPPPLTSPPDLAALAAVAAKYGLELKAPPGN